MHSNEFTGATLAEAVKKATAVYDQRKQHGANPDQERQRQEEDRKQRRCNDLILQINRLSSQAGRYADEADRLRSEAESLRRSAGEKLTFAALSAIGGLAAGLLKLRRILRIIERIRNKVHSRDDILELLAYCSGPLSALIGAALAAKDLGDADILIRKAQSLSDRAESLGREYLAVFDQYERQGCGVGKNFTGS